MSLDKIVYNGLILAIYEYIIIFGDSFWSSVRKIAAERHSTNLDLSFNFFESASEAWEDTRSKAYDLYIIDGACDNEVLKNKVFLELFGIFILLDIF